MLYEGPDLSSGPVSIGRADPAEMRAEYPFSDISADLESCLGSAETRTDVLYFAIRRDGSLVGHILLHGLDPAAGRASVAYHLSRPESRNRGTGTAALGLLLANIDRLAPVSTLEMVSERTNEASRRIAEKCGFEYCGPSPEDGSLVLYEWRGRDEGSVGGEAVGACRRGSPDPCPVSTWEKVYEVVRAIPPGRVSTYGRVAEMAGLPRGARTVGYALHALPEGGDVPWHRVINSQGRISALPDPIHCDMQRSLLEAEGVTFDASGRIADGSRFWPAPPAGFGNREG